VKALENTKGVESLRYVISQDQHFPIYEQGWNVAKLTAEFVEDYQSSLENPKLLLT
jgi:hypothetical protein